MTILSAQSIRELCKQTQAQDQAMQDQTDDPLISPFHLKLMRNGLSYGLSSASYDVCINQTLWLWPFYGRLASTMERFHLPNNICGEVKDKSTNARRFVLVQNTLIDPGWEGWLTLELTRFLPWPIRIKRGTPIAQIKFEWLDDETEIPYNGKYQNQAQEPQKAQIGTGSGYDAGLGTLSNDH